MLASIEKQAGFASLAMWSRRLTVLSYGGLQLHILLNTLWLSPPPEAARTWVILLFQLVPLWLFLPGIIRANPRSHAWLCFVSLLYFIQGVLAAFVPGKLWIGTLEAVLCSILFIAAMLFTRWQARYMKALHTGS